MINVFLESDRLYFEPLELKHLSNEYISWLNDKEVTKFNRHGVFPNNSEKTKAYIDSLKTNNNHIVLALIDKKTKKHIGNIAIQNIDLLNSNADISILIGEKSFWGKGYAIEAYKIIINHCFMKINLHRLYLGTSEYNIGMQNVAKKLNMIQEGIKRDALFQNNQYSDIYLYSILKTEYLEILKGEKNG